MKSCYSCVRIKTCGHYTAEDCGTNMSSHMVCTCGNPEYGFECTCIHSEQNPGDILYSCEFHGLYHASKPICNRCES